MTDGPLGEGAGRIRDPKTGRVYDIEGDKASEDVDGPIYGRDRDAEILSGGAGTFQPGYFVDEAETASDAHSTVVEEQQESSRELSQTEEADWVAHSAELGQKPLQAYKQDAERHGDNPDPNRRVNDIGTHAERPADEISKEVVDSTVGETKNAPSRGSSGTGHVEEVTYRATGTAASSHGAAGSTAESDTSDTSGAMVDRAGGVGQPVANRTTGGIMDNSNDNSAEGSGGDLMAQVQTGYKVVDSNGDEIGKVRDLKDGDPDSASTEGETDADLGVDDEDEMVGLATVPGGASGNNPGGAGTGVPGVLVVDEQDDDEPRADGSLRDGLIRVGYLRIDSKGWFTRDRYARADQIASVDGETVRLSVPKDSLIERR